MFVANNGRQKAFPEVLFRCQATMIHGLGSSKVDVEGNHITLRIPVPGFGDHFILDFRPATAIAATTAVTAQKIKAEHQRKGNWDSLPEETRLFIDGIIAQASKELADALRAPAYVIAKGYMSPSGAPSSTPWLWLNPIRNGNGEVQAQIVFAGGEYSPNKRWYVEERGLFGFWRPHETEYRVRRGAGKDERDSFGTFHLMVVGTDSQPAVFQTPDGFWLVTGDRMTAIEPNEVAKYLPKAATPTPGSVTKPTTGQDIRPGVPVATAEPEPEATPPTVEAAPVASTPPAEEPKVEEAEPAVEAAPTTAAAPADPVAEVKADRADTDVPYDDGFRPRRTGGKKAAEAIRVESEGRPPRDNGKGGGSRHQVVAKAVAKSATEASPLPAV